jgi:DNA-binding NtrC family response regulator
MVEQLPPAISLLLVDDEKVFLDIMAQRLKRRGFAVATADDGETALRHLQTSAIDVVVLDVAMPGMSGIETLQAIKEQQPLIEVVMLTGQATVATAVEAIRLGAFNYLKKPCEIEDLLAQINNALLRRREREARVLEVRMKPYLASDKRDEMIAAILKE